MTSSCGNFFFFNIVSWDEFEALSENLKPYTEQAMKIEVAPWIKDYVVDMDDLYTELSLEEIKNKPSGTKTQKIDHYKEMFGDHDDFRNSSQSRRVHLAEKLNFQGKSKCSVKVQATGMAIKILVKGDPGVGKTTLMKKIAFDWATEEFTKFVVVFVVFLKLVKPGESIENVIINQIPELEGMNVTPEKLTAFLETFGNRCLLILDGLDEHALGQNTDVLKIIRGQKLLYCNVIVSSRPHSTKYIEKHFPTVVRVNGFTREEAEKFTLKILGEEKKVLDVLNFSPMDFQETINLHNMPILLSFICLLVREEDIDLSSKSLSSGEIYMKMVRCLYKKFTIRSGIGYQDSEFIRTLRLLGKLAFETLLSGNLLMQRQDVLEKVGEDAFNFGLLIGHEEGILLLKDEAADILITFPHRSIQEFLGAFFFIFMLNEGTSVERLLGVHCSKPIFLENPLFLHFCVWLARSPCYFPVTDGETLRAYNSLRADVLGRIDFEQLRLADISILCPALDFPYVPDMKDKVIVTFLGDLLANCKQTRYLVMSRYESMAWTFSALQVKLSDIRSVQVWSEVNHSSCTMPAQEILSDQDCVEITLNGSNNLKKAFDCVLRLFPACAKKVCLKIVLDSDIEVDLSQFLHKELKRLCIINEG